MIGIKNIEMPKSCRSCLFNKQDCSDGFFETCIVNGRNLTNRYLHSIHPDCLLIDNIANNKVYVLVDKEDHWATVYSSKEKLKRAFYDDMIGEGYDNFDDYYNEQLRRSYYIDCTEIK